MSTQFEEAFKESEVPETTVTSQTVQAESEAVSEVVPLPVKQEVEPVPVVAEQPKKSQQLEHFKSNTEGTPPW